MSAILEMKNISGADIKIYNDQAFQQFNDKALIPCINCGRTFLPESFVHHEKACTKSNPFKSGVEK